MTRNEILARICIELDNANNKYPAFCSTHEGYAVIKEEVDELWDEIKISKCANANRMIMNETVQVAAMAVKFIESLYRHNDKVF